MPFLLCPRMLRQPTVKFYAQNMAVPHNDTTDLLTPTFYTTQSGKLKALLDTVVEESKTILDPQACLDYLELTGVLTDMLHEAQYYASLRGYELWEREAHIRFFLAKVDTVKGTIADWDARTTRMRRVCRKRVRRSVDLHAEKVAAMKRRRDEEGGGEGLRARYAVAPPAPEPFPQAWPAMDLDEGPLEMRPWWAQPFCD